MGARMQLTSIRAGDRGTGLDRYPPALFVCRRDGLPARHLPPQ